MQVHGVNMVSSLVSESLSVSAAAAMPLVGMVIIAVRAAKGDRVLKQLQVR
jgi:hypothetical protein